MKIKNGIVLILILLSQLLLGQYHDYKIKELYDVIYKRTNDYVVENGYNNSTAYTSDTTFGNLERIGYIIESNIVMYETTKDKAYLIKAVNKKLSS